MGTKYVKEPFYGFSCWPYNYALVHEFLGFYIFEI